MGKKLTPADVTAMLLTRVPDFAEARASDESFISHDDDSPYLCFGDLDRYLVDLLSRESRAPRESETVIQIFAVLNEVGNDPDPDVVNIVATTTFEGLAELPEGISAARSHLTGQAAVEFERILSWVSPDSTSNVRRAMVTLRTWLR